MISIEARDSGNPLVLEYLILGIQIDVYKRQGFASAPLSQTIAISSDSVPFSWSAVALAGSGATWLAVSPASGSDDGTITVTANLAGLQPGTYTGQVAIGATGTSNAGLIIPVTCLLYTSRCV